MTLANESSTSTRTFSVKAIKGLAQQLTTRSTNVVKTESIEIEAAEEDADVKTDREILKEKKTLRNFTMKNINNFFQTVSNSEKYETINRPASGFKIWSRMLAANQSPFSPPVSFLQNTRPFSSPDYQLSSSKPSTTRPKTIATREASEEILCARIFSREAMTQKETLLWTDIRKVLSVEVDGTFENDIEVNDEFINRWNSNIKYLSISWTNAKKLSQFIYMPTLLRIELKRNKLKSLTGIEAAKSLKVLDISNNLFSILPSQLCLLINLEELIVNGNRLTKLPYDIGQLQKLSRLECSSNIIQSLPSSLFTISTLTYLDASKNHISRLSIDFSELSSLTNLLLNRSQICRLDFINMQFCPIVSLSLNNNKLKTLPFHSLHPPYIQRLDIRNNLINELHRECIPPTIVQLYVDKNLLKEVGILTQTCPALELLSINVCPVIEVPSTISHCRNMRALYLSETHIKELPKELGQLKSLKHLTINKTLVNNIPVEILGLPNLTQLDIGNCSQLPAELQSEFNTYGITGCTKFLKEKVKESQIIEKRNNPLGKMNSRSRDTLQPSVSSVCSSNSTLEIRDEDIIYDDVLSIEKSLAETGSSRISSTLYTQSNKISSQSSKEDIRKSNFPKECNVDQISFENDCIIYDDASSIFPLKNELNANFNKYDLLNNEENRMSNYGNYQNYNLYDDAQSVTTNHILANKTINNNNKSNIDAFDTNSNSIIKIHPIVERRKTKLKSIMTLESHQEEGEISPNCDDVFELKRFSEKRKLIEEKIANSH